MFNRSSKISHFEGLCFSSPTWTLSTNNKGSVNVFVHGSRPTAIKFKPKRNDTVNDIEQRSSSQSNSMQPDIDPKSMSTVADIVRRKNVLGNFRHNIIFWYQVEAFRDPKLLRIS